MSRTEHRFAHDGKQIKLEFREWGHDGLGYRWFQPDAVEPAHVASWLLAATPEQRATALEKLTPHQDPPPVATGKTFDESFGHVTEFNVMRQVARSHWGYYQTALGREGDAIRRAEAAEARNAELLSGLEQIRDAIPSGGTISHYPAEIAELRTRAETAEAELAEAKAAVERLTRQKETLFASGGRRIDHLQDQLNEATASEGRWREEWDLLRSAVVAILNYPGESARLRDAVGSILYDRLVAAIDAQSDQDSGQHQGTRVSQDKPGPAPSASSKGETTPSSATAPAAGNVAESRDDPTPDCVVGPDAGRANFEPITPLAYEQEARAKWGDGPAPAELGGPNWRPEGEHELDRVTADSSPLGIVSDAYADHTGKYRETSLSKQNVIELLIRATWLLARRVEHLEQSERAAGRLAK